jgi:hypothetical protein
MPVDDVRWAIDYGADVILLVDCLPPADIAAAFAHGLPVIGLRHARHPRPTCHGRESSGNAYEAVKGPAVARAPRRSCG